MWKKRISCSFFFNFFVFPFTSFVFSQYQLIFPLSLSLSLYFFHFFDPFFLYRKPSGIRAGRKLRTHRRNERWSSKPYNKAHSVDHMKANPMGGSTMSKGIVLEKMYAFSSFFSVSPTDIYSLTWLIFFFLAV